MEGSAGEMEIREAFLRILRHAPVVLLCLMLGLGLGAHVAKSQTKEYAATTRLLLDTTDPKSAEESASLRDVARGIATSYDHIRKAITAADVRRNPVDVAKKITVGSVGNSNIIALTVTDADGLQSTTTVNVTVLGWQLYLPIALK